MNDAIKATCGAAVRAAENAARKAKEAAYVADLFTAMGEKAQALPDWVLVTTHGHQCDSSIHGNGRISAAEFDTLIKAFPPIPAYRYKGRYTGIASSDHATKGANDVTGGTMREIHPVWLTVERIGNWPTRIKAHWLHLLDNGLLIKFDLELKTKREGDSLGITGRVGRKYIYEPRIDARGAAVPLLAACSTPHYRVDNTSWPNYTVYSPEYSAAAEQLIRVLLAE